MKSRAVENQEPVWVQWPDLGWMGSINVGENCDAKYRNIFLGYYGEYPPRPRLCPPLLGSSWQIF
jgi:hypothetical protein